MKKIRIAVLLVAALAVLFPCQAQNLTVPHTFEAGTPARAEDVNANFATIYQAVNDAVPQGAVYRWAVFDTYSVATSWFMSNDSSMFGGVHPSNWTDASYQASNMSSDKEVLRTLLTQKGYGGKNALVYAANFIQHSSANGKVLVVLFRVKNTTADTQRWTPFFRYTAHEPWWETASVALNGTGLWAAGASGQAAVDIFLPPNRVSTVIFVSTSSAPTPVDTLYERSLQLGFYNDSLVLPAGLVYVDDLDRASGGWDQ